MGKSGDVGNHWKIHGNSKESMENLIYWSTSMGKLFTAVRLTTGTEGQRRDPKGRGIRTIEA